MKKWCSAFLLLFTFTAFSQSNEDCEKYQFGYFKYSEKHENTVVYRNQNYQMEYHTDDKEYLILTIDWTTACQYKITYIHSNMEGFEDKIGTSIIITIEEVDIYGYRYSAYFPAMDWTSTGQIIPYVNLKKKVKKQMNKILKKNIKK